MDFSNLPSIPKKRDKKASERGGFRGRRRPDRFAPNEQRQDNTGKIELTSLCPLLIIATDSLFTLNFRWRVEAEKRAKV